MSRIITLYRRTDSATQLCLEYFTEVDLVIFKLPRQLNNVKRRVGFQAWTKLIRRSVVYLRLGLYITCLVFTYRQYLITAVVNHKFVIVILNLVSYLLSLHQTRGLDTVLTSSVEGNQWTLSWRWSGKRRTATLTYKTRQNRTPSSLIDTEIFFKIA